MDPLLKNPHTPQPGQGLIALAAEATRVESLLMEIAATQGGELDAALDAYLDEIKTKLAEKPDQYKYVMDRLEVAAELLYKQADEFDRAALLADNTVKQMKVRIKEAMQLMGVSEIRGQSWQFKTSTAAKRLVIADEEKFIKDHPSYVIVKTVYAIDNKRVKEVLEGGGVIQGATLEGGIRLNPPTVVKASS